MDDKVNGAYFSGERVSDVVCQEFQIVAFAKIVKPLGDSASEVVKENDSGLAGMKGVIPLQDRLNQVVPQKPRTARYQQLSAAEQTKVISEFGDDIGQISPTNVARCGSQGGRNHGPEIFSLRQ
jgi:hypothetical protein